MFKSIQSIVPFFSFCGNAEEAMNFYVSVFPDSKIISLKYFTGEVHGEVGKVLNGIFELKGQQFMVMDMEKQYCPEFTWATSLFINCVDKEEFDFLFNELSAEGTVIMGPEPVMQLRLVSWLTDKFGVTWQLVWE
ncbi:MAG: VOC family protein [Sebaldella sp.]|nr:VOC family protein [Sebaldella sp.]